nr:cytochrome P450 6HZ3 [Pagiophloeus tsushimanus]
MFLLYLFLFLSALFVFLKRKHSYWSRRGVAQIEPEFFFGNVKKVVLQQTNIDTVIQGMYHEFKKRNAKSGGLYMMYNPNWIPVDVELIKQIMTTDYEYFGAHGFYHDESDNLTMNLFNLNGAQWKNLRAKLSPTFTSGKLKLMFDIVNTISDRIVSNVDKLCKKRQPIEVKEFTAQFGTDVTAICFFGLDCNSMEEPNNDLRKNGRLFTQMRPIRIWLEQNFNWKLLARLGYTFVPSDLIKFFNGIAKNSIEYREKNNISRKDYLNLLIQLKNKGTLDGDGNVKETTKGNDMLTFDEVVGNMFLMYVAGFETSSTTTTYLLYEIAKNQDIQNKCRQEILKIFENRADNSLTYEDLAEMKYCEMCIYESLRRHMPVPEVPRMCTKDYKIPGTDQVVEKNTLVLIPGFSVHNDPDYYPNPSVYDPERFNEANKQTRPDFAFLGFGGGPRYCLGFRFAIMQIKIALVKYLTNYRYTLNPKTPKVLEYVSNSLFLTAKCDILLDITKIK